MRASVRAAAPVQHVLQAAQLLQLVHVPQPVALALLALAHVPLALLQLAQLPQHVPPVAHRLVLPVEWA